VTRACIAGAGPVIDGGIELTNCPWTIDAKELAAALDLSACRLLNDFEALAFSLPLLGPADCVPLGGDRALPDAPRLVLGPGTGFGAALLVPAPGGAVVVPTEAGHIALGLGDAPAVQALIGDGTAEAVVGRLTVEALLSGSGIEKLYRAVCRARGLPARLQTAPAIVAAVGADGEAAAAVGHFAALLGAAAGDIALATGARGGVFIAGGIAPRLLPQLAAGSFRRHFEDKAPMRAWLAAIPTAVVVAEQPALLGLAGLAGAG
jgi:glucokinase